MKTRIALLGPPATGKATQAALLSAAFGLPAASTGAMLRTEKTRGSEAGREAEKWTDHGLLVPDELALRIVWQWLGKRTRFLLDGFPRTLGQAESFDAGLEKRGLPLDAVYLLDLSEDAIRGRMVSRLTCPACGAVYNESFHRITGESPCPACGATLSRRSDDTNEALDRRMAQYREQTLPVAGHYQKKGLLKQVDASPGREAVFNALYEDLQVETLADV